MHGHGQEQRANDKMDTWNFSGRERREIRRVALVAAIDNESWLWSFEAWLTMIHNRDEISAGDESWLGAGDW